MYDALEEIVKINQQQDPDDAGFYTVEWARQFCARLKKTPEDHLAQLKADEAARKATDWDAFKKESDDKAKANPEFYKYMTGPVDGFSYGLMLNSGEIDNVDSSK